MEIIHQFKENIPLPMGKVPWSMEKVPLSMVREETGTRSSNHVLVTAQLG